MPNACCFLPVPGRKQQASVLALEIAVTRGLIL
jgi:hypothetical protein